MRPIDGPVFLTPDQRLHEVANIMANGVLRLYARAALSGDDSGQKNLPNSGKPHWTSEDEVAIPTLS